MSYLSFILANPRFLGFGLFLTFSSSFGQTFFISLFGNELRNDFGLSHGEFGGVYSLATLSSGVFLIWAGRAIDRLDLRLFTGLVVLGLAGASFILANATSLLLLGLAIFGLRLFGQGLLGHIAMVCMARYFEKARGKAVSLATLGYPLGEAALPFMAVAVLGAYGWRVSWEFFTAAIVILIFPIAMLLLRSAPHRNVTEPDNPGSSSKRAARKSSGREASLGEVLRDSRFYLILPAILAPSFITTGMFFHQRHLADVKGWSLELLASAFVIFAISQSLTGLSAGQAIDRFGARRLLPVFLLPMGTAMLLLSFSDASLSAQLYMLATGATAGAGAALFGALWAELYGVRHLGAIRSFVTSLMVFSTALSPPFMGLLFDAGIAFESLTLGYFIYCVLVSGFLSLILRRKAWSGV
ncbi:MFS transporter [Denitrobaculum tricleocarpae]|uniref:MFS transporter n=1 Tax=Denitrobaculum tricleocarpae TaxID=2591009 RepID=A0A545TPT5_9PROT|nr:MFS transporter [Denitrobaculum tricleocarpae]TQV79233.1 MFS transporter [Denitrobaculum tricleocarpae]